MIHRKTGHQRFEDPLERSLASPQPQSIRLLAELVSPGSIGRPLLVTSPVQGPWSALVAGDLASAARDMGYGDVGILDLRGPAGMDAPEDSGPAEGVADADTPGQSLLREIRTLRPTRDQIDNGSKLREWVAKQVEECAPLVLLTGGTLDPSHWLEDPLSWSFLEPTVLVACGSGKHTGDQISQTAERLGRAGLAPAGNVMVSRRSSANPLNYLKWIRDIVPGLPVLGRKVEA